MAKHEEMKMEHEKGRKERKHGGRLEKKKHGGKVEGKKPEHRMDKRARGGRMTPKEPFSGAGDTSGGVEPEKEDRRSGGRLTASDRNALPASDFALAGRGAGKSGKGSGSYPIPDRSHAIQAKRMASAHASPAEKKKVDAAVARKIPELAGRVSRGRD